MFNTSEYSLEQLCDITDGSHFSPEASEIGYPMLSVKDMGEYGFNYDSCKRISKESFDDMVKNNCVPQKGDVLVAKDGSYLKEIFVQEEYREEAILSSIAIFRPKKELIIPEFLCYLLKSPAVLQYIKDNCVSGSAIPRIVLKSFKKVRLSIPDMGIQRSIVQIIRSFDDKIRCNREINDYLDSQLKIHFKTLFTDNFNLKYGKLSDVCNVEKGLSYKGEGLTEEGVPLINLGNITPGGGYRQDKNKNYSGEYKSKHIVKPGDIIIANTDMTYDRVILGSPIIVPYYSGDILFTHHLFAFRNVKIPKSYLYYYLRTDEFHGLCESSANGTTVLAITKDDVLNAVIPLPSIDLLEKFTDIADPYLELMRSNDEENNRLTELRDTLLPKLMSGEIDVSKLELNS